MSEERILQLESRVGTMEQIVRGLEARLSRMERPARLEAPPVQATPPPTYQVPAVRTPQPAQTPPPPPVDTEYQLGAQWLPRIGAGFVVLGISCLIALAVNRGWITPPMLFGGALTLCGIFMFLGQWLRDEREDFGQVLTGIGSCGVFATFAGGHIFQDLYSGEVMVGAFVVWGLANLGYALWKASQSFLAIGIIGGFLGAAMPVSKEAYLLSLGLHSIILLVSAAIIVRHRFTFASVGLWVASMLALLPIALASQVDWALRVTAIELSTLIVVLAYLLGRKKEDPDTDRAFVGCLIGFIAMASFGIRQGTDGSLHLLSLAFVCAAMAYAFRGEKVLCHTWGWLAVGIGVLMSPMGLQRIDAAFYYVAASFIASVAGMAVARKEPIIVASAALPASIVMYVLSFEKAPLPQATEVSLLVSILLATATLAFSLRKEETDLRNGMAFVIGWGIVSKLGGVSIQSNGLRDVSLMVTLTWVLYAAVLLIVGFVGNIRNYRYASLIVFLGAVSKVLLLDMATATPELRVAVLLAVGIALVAGGYGYVRRRRSIS